ncbi:MAG: transposase domain-containing protein [Myxococcales bacterium]|nr:transposase domain-containing protein [Myxococcales bacterium]
MCRGPITLVLTTPGGISGYSEPVGGLIETAKVNGLEPFAYLRYVFPELPKATTLDQVEALLPSHVDPERLQDPSQFSPAG